MKIAVVNSSAGVYNLGAARIAAKCRQEGHEVFESPRADMWSMQCQKAFMSCIFTYDLPDLVRDANILLANNVEVEVGGPAATALPEYITEQTGIIPHLGLDDRFEHVNGTRFQATFTSRGCPRACEFCLVPKLEGRKMIEYDDFSIPSGRNPYVCDNNLLATSRSHQELVVRKLRQVRNLDLNSGFDDRMFIRDPDYYWHLYSQLHLEAWRFAYDSPEQKEPVKACADFLHDKGLNYRNIIVFCLVGGPGMTFEESQERLEYLINIRTSPYPMRYRPLDSLERNYLPPGWRPGQIEKLFAYYGVPFVWRSCTWSEFEWKGESRATT